MKSFFVLLSTLFCLCANAQNMFDLKGSIKGVSNNASIIIRDNEKIIDSCKMVNGRFNLKGTLLIEPSDAILIVNDVEKKYQSPIFIGNEKLTINASVNDFPYNIKLKGAKYDDVRFSYMQKIKFLHTQKEKVIGEINQFKAQNVWNDSLQKKYFSEVNPKGELIKLDDTYQTVMNQFIKDNANSPFTIRLLDMSKQTYSKKELTDVFKKINTTDFNSNYNYLSIKSYLSNFDLEEGDLFINFKAFDVNNNVIEFAERFSGKNVLLNFSSLHCEWCSKALPKIEQIVKNNKDKVDVVIFYIDDDAMDNDSLLQKQSENYLTIWDPTREFKTYMEYKINTTPTFYLFDKQGKLIKKFEGYNTELEHTIDQL